ncbi:FAD-binding domain-containing protein [Polyplosphaeria fusca]|uniref:FAD-binding domain-containing protein n=1 Tax=Polyplosphaeria fusca TaxID=682080 RepID=A0A9P4QZ10_9PLEO|nr:FAD-binding domain-containing protein [Polyplosphaeria fusca]
MKTDSNRKIKNWEARLHQPIATVAPKKVRHLQEIVRWASRNETKLTVLGGSHSGHCLWRNAVAIDMSAFKQIHVKETSYEDSLVFVEAGCTSGEIVRKTMAEGLTVPLGTRPSVGAGLWLQGGIGHLTRLYRLTCDSIVGVVLVSVDSGKIIFAGDVDKELLPPDAVRAENEDELLWAVKGAGTNFGIVVSVVFRAYPAPTYKVKHTVDTSETREDTVRRLEHLNDVVAERLGYHHSAEAYLFWSFGSMRFGVTFLEVSPTTASPPLPTIFGPQPQIRIRQLHLSPPTSPNVVDGIGIFEKTYMRLREMQDGHFSNETCSFKRCVFLENFDDPCTKQKLSEAFEKAPTPLSYLHLVLGGGKMGEVTAHTTSFGCRKWTFACTITAVWWAYENGTVVMQNAIDWVYKVATDLSSLNACVGVYSADLGPDPRDLPLAKKAFGPNLPRLAQLKKRMDPNNILAFACPLDAA